MSNRRERTLQDLCDATSTLSQPQVTPILRGNLRMQGPIDEANCHSLTHMVTSDNSEGFGSCCDRGQKVDHRGKSGTCNVCAAPCSSCFHGNKFLLKERDESAGEICTGNIETCQPSILSTVGGMESTSDSFSENAAGKVSSRTSNASASDDSVVHSKSEGRRSPEGHDDCLSCVSGTDEHANRKSDTEDSGMKDNKQSKISGEISDKVSPSSSQTGMFSQNSAMVGVSFTKSTNDASDLLKVQATSQVSTDKCPSHEQNPRDVKEEKPSDNNEDLLKGSTEHLNSSSPSVMAPDVVCDDPPATALNFIERMEVEIHPNDETDDSDALEHDVKVCDICGDAGREDLLAICCRCSDGAEHTYCMREMLDKVPEGEWFCEECKTVELVENGSQENIGRMDVNEKNNSSGQASENLNSSDIEGHKTKASTRIPCKRPRDDDDAEVSSVVKKPALESIIGESKTSNSSKTAALSRESSLKNLENGRPQSSHHPSDTVPVNDTMEPPRSASDLRVHNFRGTFSKSNSFNSLNAKPKVKLVDQVVIQRQKSAKEHGSVRPKEGIVRSIGKSMSFKSTNSTRSESKTKMLSPRLSQVQDVKNTKERIERQRSFRTENPSTNSMIGTSMNSTSRIDKRPASRVESSSPTAITNQHEMKPVQTDGKSAALSRSSSLATRRAADISSSTGEYKRPSTCGHTTPGVLSPMELIISNKKHNETIVKQDSFSFSVVSEKLLFNANEGIPDGLTRPKDGSRIGPPSIRTPREENDSLKAAIEAAVLRKPGVYRKHRALVQPDVSSMPTVGCEVASHQDHISSATKKKLSSDAELPQRPVVSPNLTVDSLKEETLNNVKQSLLVPVEGLSSGGRDRVQIGHSSREVFSNVPAVMPLLLKSLAIPEHEYIWQGSFEIYRSGQVFDLCDGIQAHLSTCASSKVIEAVNKFKSRIVLHEIPRLSTWPVQFQENGIREDNIALFFFAKDLESYDKIYKVLLDNMMKNDLALKGYVNGVELLIFPSNQLPDNLQRWNMLFFLWGVFRGRKESCLQQMPTSSNQYCAPPDIPTPIMTLPENRCSFRPITENASQDVDPLDEVPASEESRSLLSSRVVKRDCITKISSLDRLDHALNSGSSCAVQSDSAKQCQEMKGSYQERDISSSYGSPLPMNSYSSGREQMLMQLDSPVGRQHSPGGSSKYMSGMPKKGIGIGTTLQKTCHQNQVKLRIDSKDPSTDGEIPLQDDQNMKDLNLEHGRWLFKQEEGSMHPGSSVVPRTFYTGTSQLSPRNDDMHSETCGAVEKMNHVPSGCDALQNQHVEASVETLGPKCYDNAERRFFPVELHLLKEGRLNDRAPNLELALGAETKPLTLGFEPLLVSKLDKKVRDEHIIQPAEIKVEDDVSASLSLSLSFPFPENELNTKPTPKTEPVMSQRKPVNTSSMLLFGNLRDN